MKHRIRYLMVGLSGLIRRYLINLRSVCLSVRLFYGRIWMMDGWMKEQLLLRLF